MGPKPCTELPLPLAWAQSLSPRSNLSRESPLWGDRVKCQEAPDGAPGQLSSSTGCMGGNKEEQEVQRAHSHLHCGHGTMQYSAVEGCSSRGARHLRQCSAGTTAHGTEKRRQMGAGKRFISLLPPETITVHPTPTRSACAELASSTDPGSPLREGQVSQCTPLPPPLTGPGGRGAWAPR